MAASTIHAVELRKPGSAQAVTLIFVAALPVMGSVLLSPSVPTMLSVFGSMQVDPYMVMTAIAAPAASIGLLSPLVGPIVDRWGRRRALLWALALYGFLGTAPLLLTSIVTIIAARLALGVTEAVILTANLTLLGDYFQGEQRVKWLATQSSALPIFGSLFFLVGGTLSAISWRAPFAAYACSFVLFLLAVLLIFEPARADAPLSWQASAPPRASPPRGAFLLLCCVTLVSLMLFFIVPIQFAVLLNADTVIPPAQAGMAMAVTAVGNAIGAFSFRYISRYSAYLLLGIAFSIAGVSLMVAATAQSLVVMTGAGFCNQVGCGVVVPALAAATLTTLPPEKRGAGSSRWWSCFYLGNFLSPMVVVYAIQSTGGIRHGFMLLSIVNLIFALVVIVPYLLWRRSARS